MLARIAARARRVGFEGPFYEGVLGKARFLVESTVARSELIFVATPSSLRSDADAITLDLRVASNVDALAPYRAAFDAEYYEGFSESWNAPFTWGEEAVVGLVGGAPAAIAWVQRGTVQGFPTYHGPLLADDARILRVGVAPSFRRRGVNTALMRAMLRHLFAEGRRTVFIECYLNNVPSVKTFLRVGFQPVGLIDVLELPGLRRFVRWRALADAEQRLATYDVRLGAASSDDR